MMVEDIVVSRDELEDFKEELDSINKELDKNIIYMLVIGVSCFIIGLGLGYIIWG